MTHPAVLRGALVQLAEGMLGPVPNVVAFQYNPATLSHSVEPFQARSSGSGEPTGPAPAVQPSEPTETFDLTLELDASDDLGQQHPVALAVGVGDRLAALEKMLRPSTGLFADLAAATSALFDGQPPAGVPERPTVPIIFFVWGASRMLPVRIVSYTVEEQSFTTTLSPIHAAVTIGLEVLTPSQFQCREGGAADLARTAYEVHQATQASLAAVYFQTNVEAGLSLLGGV